MKRWHSRGWLGLFLFAFLAPQAQAENTILWTKGYPKATATAGEVEVKGNIILANKNWRIPSNRVIVFFCINGGSGNEGLGRVQATATGYEYHHILPKLESGKTYLGFIEVTITDGKNTETLRTGIEEVIPK